MDAFTRIAETLGSIVKTPEERRREKNRRYAERNPMVYEVYVSNRRLLRLKKLLEEPNANH